MMANPVVFVGGYVPSWAEEEMAWAFLMAPIVAAPFVEFLTYALFLHRRIVAPWGLWGLCKAVLLIHCFTLPLAQLLPWDIVRVEVLVAFIEFAFLGIVLARRPIVSKRVPWYSLLSLSMCANGITAVLGVLVEMSDVTDVTGTASVVILLPLILTATLFVVLQRIVPKRVVCEDPSVESVVESVAIAGGSRS